MGQVGQLHHQYFGRDRGNSDVIALMKSLLVKAAQPMLTLMLPGFCLTHYPMIARGIMGNGLDLSSWTLYTNGHSQLFAHPIDGQLIINQPNAEAGQ